MDQAIRDFFRDERVRQKLSQTDVAQKAGIEQATISKIEKEKNYEPGLTTFQQAVAGLGMTLSGFFAELEAHTTGGQLAAAGGSAHDLGVRKGGAKRHDRAVSSGPPLAVEDLRAVIIAVGETLGESIERAVTRSIVARQQTPDPRAHAPVRRRRR
jgi:transcriptional regulator with XRE-family HTH domain